MKEEVLLLDQVEYERYRDLLLFKAQTKTPLQMQWDFAYFILLRTNSWFFNIVFTFAARAEPQLLEQGQHYD